MKVYLDRFEWWPVYSACAENVYTSYEFELTEAELAEYRRVVREFNDWQIRLAAAYVSWEQSARSSYDDDEEGFYEDDEDPDEVVVAFDAGEKFTTGKPADGTFTTGTTVQITQPS